jgi:membrane protease subunit (stomatin/prohibitin family)
VRVFGELAFKVTDPTKLLAKLIGTGAEGDFDTEISTWVKEQTLAAIRAVLPDLVAQHGVLAMGQLQDATSEAALAKANEKLADYGLAITTFAELNVNLPDSDAEQLKQLAATKAYTGVAGSFDSAVRGEAALEIAHGVSNGNVGAQPAVVAGMMMGLPVAPGAPQAAPAAAPATPAAAQTAAPVAAPSVAPVGPATPVAPATDAAEPSTAATNAAEPSTAQPADGTSAADAAGEAVSAHFCSQCGTAIAPGTHFCPNCGAAVTAEQS